MTLIDQGNFFWYYGTMSRSGVRPPAGTSIFVLQDKPFDGFFFFFFCFFQLALNLLFCLVFLRICGNIGGGQPLSLAQIMYLLQGMLYCRRDGVDTRTMALMQMMLSAFRPVIASDVKWCAFTPGS